MTAEKANFPVTLMSRVLEVSRSGFYAWCGREASARAKADEALKVQIVAIHEWSRGTYGVPRVQAELEAMGERLSRKRVARLMRELGIEGVSRRKGTRTTKRDRQARPARTWLSAISAPMRRDRLWVADITYCPTWAGFLFLAVVVDAFSRRVGRLVDGQSSAHLAGTRCAQHGVGSTPSRGGGDSSFRPGYAIYFDCVWQRCQAMKVRPSMGSVGDCFDNAVAESFFATLECELIDRGVWRTQAEARMAIFEFIEW